MNGAAQQGWLPEAEDPGLVSVIIPTYNRGELLKSALASIASQTYRRLECIVVDDGSTDDIAALVAEFKNNHADISVVYKRQDNAGSAFARNSGTLLSSGAFIQYLDSDDILYKNKLEEQVIFLKSTHAVAVFGDWEVGTEEHKAFVKAYASENMIEQMLVGRCIANFSMLMRRELVDKIGPWDVNIKRNQEIDYHLRGLMLVKRFDYLQSNTGLHRQHKEVRITTNTGIPEIHNFYRKWEGILTANNLFDKPLQEKFAKMYMWFFTSDVNYNKSVLNLLQDALRLAPENTFFSSRRFRFLKKIMGEKLALQCWLRWLLYNRKLQRAT